MATIFSNISIVCFILAGVSFAIAIAAFFVMDTKAAYRELKGKPQTVWNKEKEKKKIKSTAPVASKEDTEMITEVQTQVILNAAEQKKSKENLLVILILVLVMGMVPVTKVRAENAEFLTFTGFTNENDLGTLVIQKDGENEIEVYWYNQLKEIKKEGFEFSETPEDISSWVETYIVSKENPVKIYAKNEEGLVSDGIYVAYDYTAPEGDIFVTVGGEEKTVSNKMYGAEYQVISKGDEINITFRGRDEHSKISSIEWYGSNTALTTEESEMENVWSEISPIDIEVIEVNTSAEKYENLPANENVPIVMESIPATSEMKRFYYAKIVDFAGNVSYISSGGVLQDVIQPEVTIELAATQAIYEEKNVYSGDVEFTVKITDAGISSGISEVEAVLTRNGRNILTEKLSEKSEPSIWTWSEKISAIQILNDIKNPTDRLISDANSGYMKGILKDLEDGNYYTLTIKARDKADHSHTISVDFIKDQGRPEIQIINHLEYEVARTDLSAYTGGTIQIQVSDMTLCSSRMEFIECEDQREILWGAPEVGMNGLMTQTATIKFGPEEGMYHEGTYEFVVEAVDVWNHLSETEAKTFTIDYTAPTFQVSYNEPAENAYIGDNNKLYYNKEFEATFVIDEDTTFEEDILAVTVKNTAENSLVEPVDVIKWENGIAATENENYVLEHDADTREFKIKIKGVTQNNNDGYTFHLSGKDKAGNALIAASATDAEEIGKVRAMDVTAPILSSIVYDTEAAFHTVGTRDYVNAPTKMTFTIVEHHPTTTQSFITSDFEEKNIDWREREENVYITELNIPMLGEKGDEQTVTLTIVDKAGNAAVLAEDANGDEMALRSTVNTKFEAGVFTDKFTVDTVLPRIQLEYEDFNPDRLNIEGIDYFKQPVSVKMTIDEHNFDENFFTQSVKKIDENITYAESAWTTIGDTHVKIFTFSQDQLYQLSINGTDYAKNPLFFVATDGMTATSEENNIVTLKVAIDQTIPAIGDTAKPVVVAGLFSPENSTVDGQALYGTDVVYEVSVYDPLCNQYASGIDNLTFRIRGEDGTTAISTVDRTGKIVNGTGITVTRVEGDVTRLAQGSGNRYTFHVTISSDIFNTNGINLSVDTEDISKNKKEMTTEPIAIDTTEPEVRISYDNNDVSNEKYFHAERMAEITVVERNFSDDCFKLYVNGDEKVLKFQFSNTGRGNRDDAVWKASYSFDSDGDYQVEATVQDRAANVGTVSYNGVASQDFTIDTTTPVVEIEFDNHNVFYESYYDAQRVATIVIRERNFDGSDVVIIGESAEAGEQVPYPILSAWSSHGDEHRAALTFARDALYTLDVEYADLASNEANDVQEESFTIDTTVPEVKITGVKHETPYSGEVRPRIEFSDNHYDRYEAVLTRTERENLEMDVTEEMIGNIGVLVDATGKGVGEKIIEDVEHLTENDGIYVLTVTVYDKAGHVTEETVNYSVNRFGSVYVYSRDLTEMLNGYYKAASGDLYITVYNADQLLENSTKLEINCDGTLLTNQNSRADVEDALQQNNGGWFEYKFEIKQADLVKDGRYTITFSDKDEAGNTRTNSDHPIEFYIDATAPMLDSVIGLEEAIVNADKQTVQYTISDAIALENLKIYINGELFDNINAFERLTAHSGTFSIGTGMKQKVRIVAEDKAGNVLDTSEESFTPGYAFHDEITVSTDFLIRWYANTPLFWGTIAGSVAVVVGVIFLHKFLRISHFYSSSS